VPNDFRSHKFSTEARRPAATHKSAYFLSLAVENVRCFKGPVTLDLSDGHGRPAPWTILLGDNGVGKTTLLQCLAGMRPTEWKSPQQEAFVLVPHSFARAVAGKQSLLINATASSGRIECKAAFGTQLKDSEKNNFTCSFWFEFLKKWRCHS